MTYFNEPKQVPDGHHVSFQEFRDCFSLLVPKYLIIIVHQILLTIKETQGRVWMAPCTSSPCQGPVVG